MLPSFNRVPVLFALAGLAALASACSSSEVIPPGAGDAAPPPVVVQAEVTVQGPDTSEPPTQGAEADQADDPAVTLKAALEAKDYAALEALLASSFGFGLIASEGMTYTPGEFVEQLRSSYLEPGNVRVDLARDVRAEASPDYQGLVDSYARTLYSTGWGESQADTALLFLDEQGRWVGMLYMFEGLEELLFASGDESEAPPGVDNKNLGAFQTALLEGITTDRDYALLQALMGDPFVIGYWRSEGAELTPPVAVEQLQADLLPPTAFVNYTLGADLAGMLEGQNPLTMWGPNVKAVRAIHSTGWGADGKGEVILIIAQRPDGTYYWHGLLYAAGGF